MIAAGSTDLLPQILWLGAVLLMLIVVGAILIYFVRRQMRVDDTAEPFTLQDLRALRAQGSLSEREYELMRAGLIGDATRAQADDRGTKPRSDRATNDADDV